METQNPNIPYTNVEKNASLLLVATFIAWQTAVAKYVTFGGGEDDPSQESFDHALTIVKEAQVNVVKLLAGKSIDLAQGQSITLDDDTGRRLGQIYAHNLSELPDAITKELGLDVTTH